MEIKEKLNKLPELPGIYLMLDKDGNIIYVGKARVLKKRVKQYFNASFKDIKVSIMMEHVKDFRYIITNNEIEALMLENNFIKKYKPHYNILLKDDRAYPFIKINTQIKYPKIEIVRKIKNDGSKYFGPYMLGISVNDMIEVIESAFQLRNCKIDFDKKLKKSHRPCLNYHINRCIAPCINEVEEDYFKILNDVLNFLSGHDKKVREILTKKMQKASEIQDFENAMYYRNKIKILEKIERKQIAILKKDYDLDIFAICHSEQQIAISLIVVRAGKIIGEKNFLAPDASLSKSEGLSSLIRQYYTLQSINIGEIVVSMDLDDREEIKKYLSDIKGSQVKIVKPNKGIRKELVNTAKKNAEEYLRMNQKKSENQFDKTIGALELLRDLLHLRNIPKRIEGYDISNISGQYKVSSMVVFCDGVPKRSDYRRFKIETVEGTNDFASMKETLKRRLERFKLKIEEKNINESFYKKPDLILIDGGVGQLSSAREALIESEISEIDIISLAKKNEEIYTTYQDEPIVLNKNNPALKLLMRVRDEAHRFAITYFRKLKENNEFQSVLAELTGIGNTKIKFLYNHFESLDNIKKASVEELLKCEKISLKDAHNIKEYFKKNKKN